MEKLILILPERKKILKKTPKNTLKKPPKKHSTKTLTTPLTTISEVNESIYEYGFDSLDETKTEDTDEQ